MAGRKNPSRHSYHHQPASRSVRAHGLAQRRDERGGPAILRLVQIPVLALRACPAASGQGTPDLPRVPADAARRKLQPRRSQSRDGTKDGPGAGRRQRAQQLAALTLPRAARKGRPPFFLCVRVRLIQGGTMSSSDRRFFVAVRPGAAPPPFGPAQPPENPRWAFTPATTDPPPPASTT